MKTILTFVSSFQWVVEHRHKLFGSWVTNSLRLPQNSGVISLRIRGSFRPEFGENFAQNLSGQFLYLVRRDPFKWCANGSIFQLQLFLRLFCVAREQSVGNKGDAVGWLVIQRGWTGVEKKPLFRRLRWCALLLGIISSVRRLTVHGLAGRKIFPVWRSGLLFAQGERLVLGTVHGIPVELDFRAPRGVGRSHLRGTVTFPRDEIISVGGTPW